VKSQQLPTLCLQTRSFLPPEQREIAMMKPRLLSARHQKQCSGPRRVLCRLSEQRNPGAKPPPPPPPPPPNPALIKTLEAALDSISKVSDASPHAELSLGSPCKSSPCSCQREGTALLPITTWPLTPPPLRPQFVMAADSKRKKKAADAAEEGVEVEVEQSKLVSFTADNSADRLVKVRPPVTV
jgi:hypothetical protein